MGQLDKQPDNSQADELQAANARLRSMAHDIENLRQTIIGQLSEDVERLQREKSQLIEDIENLQAQRQQQLVQQQQVVGQIAPTLANQLIELLTQRLNQLADSSQVSASEQTGRNLTGKPMRSQRESPTSPASPLNPTASEHNESIYRAIASLDATLRATFRTLQRDLSSYQSSLSQQLAQMYSLEQQGEAILEALVNRLREEVESQSSAIQSLPIPPSDVPTPPSLPEYNRYGYAETSYNSSIISSPSEPSVPMEPLMLEQGRVEDGEKAQAISPSQPQQASNRPLGLLLCLLSLLALSLEHIIISVIFNKSSLLGLSEPLGGFLSPSVGNSLLVLWMRMLVVTPLMGILAARTYPEMWREVQQFTQSKNLLLYLNVLSSGFCLFLSQVFIYLALASISPGVAITVFFIYPVVTALLGWAKFGDRPSLLRSLLMFVVLVGFMAITLVSSRDGELSRLGISAATGSGIAFALYIIISQTCRTKLRPVPFSWINSAIVLVFSSLSLLVGLALPESWGFQAEPNLPWLSLGISSLVLGGIVFLSDALNKIAMKMIRDEASILKAALPALTTLLALAFLQKALQVQQILGLLLVCLGVAALSFEQWRRYIKASQSAMRNSKN